MVKYREESGNLNTLRKRTHQSENVSEFITTLASWGTEKKHLSINKASEFLGYQNERMQEQVDDEKRMSSFEYISPNSILRFD